MHCLWFVDGLVQRIQTRLRSDETQETTPFDGGDTREGATMQFEEIKLNGIGPTAEEIRSFKEIELAIMTEFNWEDRLVGQRRSKEFGHEVDQSLRKGISVFRFELMMAHLAIIELRFMVD
jgi:hypothetical protein